ncbi:MAG TPA: hypothetical protein VKM94_15360 [Blastocatellia bacterium]|nr:hypothetical protein [Blastocatellia bacterium]
MSSQPPYGYGQGGGYQQGGGYGGPPPPGSTPEKTKVGNLDYNVAALLNYLPSCLCCINLVPCILWLATEPKENRFLRFHSIQGLLLFGVWVAIWIVFAILGAVLGVGSMMAPSASGVGLATAGAGLILLVVRLAVLIVLLIIHVLAMVKANQGQMWKLPIIGDIAEKNS